MIPTTRIGFTLTSLLALLVGSVALIAEAKDCGPAPEGFGPATRQTPSALENIAPNMRFRAPLGWIVAPTEADAICVALEMQAAEAAFIEHFGVAPEPGVVLDVTHVDLMKVLRESGMPWILPWRFASGSVLSTTPDPREAIVRAQIQAQLAASGKAAEAGQIDDLVQRALGALGETVGESGGGAASGKALERTAIRHELAHLWFIRWVWGSEDKASQGYASSAPDWLDEIAAVAAESPQMTRSRRRHFAEALAAGRWIPLRQFTTMPHPALASPEMAALLTKAREQARASGAGVVSMPLDDPEQAEQGLLFYSQARSVLDYFRYRSRSPAVLRIIAHALRDGTSFSDWLKVSGPSLGLAADVEALQRDWLTWARKQPPVPPTEAGN